MRFSLIKNIAIVLTTCVTLTAVAILSKRTSTPPSQETMTTLSCEQPGELLIQTLTRGQAHQTNQRALNARQEMMMALAGEQPQRWHISHDQRTALMHMLRPSTLPGGIKLVELACAKDQYSLGLERAAQQRPLWLTLRANAPALIWIDDKTVISFELRGPDAPAPAVANTQGQWLLHQALAVTLSTLHLH